MAAPNVFAPTIAFGPDVNISEAVEGLLYVSCSVCIPDNESGIPFWALLIPFSNEALLCGFATFFC